MRAFRRLLVMLCALPLAGCVVGAPEIAEEIDIVQWDLRPFDVRHATEVHVGRGLLGLASTAARWSDDHDAAFAADVLDGIDAVHVGVFELDRHPDSPGDLSFAAREELAALGWQLMVRTREDFDETAWVFGRPAGARQTEMLVVVIEHDELVVVRVDGDPARLMHAAVRRDRDFAVVAHSVGDEF